MISQRLISSTLVRKELQLPLDFVLVQPDRQVRSCYLLTCCIPINLALTRNNLLLFQLIKGGDLEDVRGTWLPSGNGELKRRTYFLFNDLFVKGSLAATKDAPCS